MTAVNGQEVQTRLKGQSSATDATAPALPDDQSGSLKYLAAVMHGEIKPEGDLSALDTNVVVMQILTAARESAQTGRTIALHALPQ